MPKSKNHIKRWITQNEHKEKILLGKEILEKGLRKLKRISLLNLYELSKTNEILLDDGIHISKKAHQYIAKFILKIINS